MDKAAFIARLKGTCVLGLDIETTGVKDTDCIIEIGMIELLEGIAHPAYPKGITRMFGGGSSSPEALRVHGITDEERKGIKTFAQKASGFVKAITTVRKGTDGTPLKTVIVGHNVEKFDLKMLFGACKAAGSPVVPTQQIYVADTLKLSRTYIGSASPDHKLETLCKVFNIKHGAHRGLGDTRSSLNILAVCLERGNVNNIIDVCTPLAV
jgi:DNA polymerase III epsilon subunit-like protein